MSKRILSFITKNYAIIAILLVASVLRLWNFYHIPFTYDEFSALFRTQFDSFSEMIEHGARVDGHPAGIQVFLFYWVKLVGFSEPWVKLPFIIAGIVSVYLVWKIGKLWFGEAAGLFSAACLAMLQFPVIYSQIARPYGSGLFFVLLAAFYWTKIVQDKISRFGMHHVGFAISGALCAYNHHFSLLMIGLIGMTGFFFLKGRRLLHYIIAGVLVFVLYIPHLGIFFHQLSLKGIGQWVAVPTPVFFVNYFKYIFEFSILLLTVFVVCFIIALNKSIISKEFKITRYTLISFLWFIIPPLIGYWYSVNVAPLLQFSMLIFSFPFLLLFLGSFWGKVVSKLNLVLILVLSLTMIYTLVFTREHYKFFYHSAYSQSIQDARCFALDHPDDNLLLVCSHRPEIADFYLKRYSLPANVEMVCLDTIKTPLQLKSHLERNEFQYAMFAGIANSFPETFPYVASFFPGLVSVNNYEQGTLSVFSKYSVNKHNPYFTEIFEYFSNSKKNTFENASINFDQSKIVFDSLSQSECFILDSLNEWGPSLKTDPNLILTSKSDIIDACASVKSLDTAGKACLVISIDNKDSNLFWQAVNIDSHTVGINEWSPVCVTFFYPDFYHSLKGATLNVYFWNNDRKTILIDQFGLRVRHGNKYLYWFSLGKIK